jgi:hypothetical protein
MKGKKKFFGVFAKQTDKCQVFFVPTIFPIKTQKRVFFVFFLKLISGKKLKHVALIYLR